MKRPEQSKWRRKLVQKIRKPKIGKRQQRTMANIRKQRTRGV